MASSWVCITDVFLVGLGSVIIVVVHIGSPGLLAFTTLPPLSLPFSLPLPLPSLPFPFCTSSLLLLSILTFFFFLAAPASADDMARFLELVGKCLWLLQVVAAVEQVLAML